MTEPLNRLLGDLARALEAEAHTGAASFFLAPRTDRPEPAPSGPEALLDAIAEEARTCSRCRLCRSRTMAVPGEGSAVTPLMVIGEAPGHDEDREGRPFVGRAGELLTKMLAAIGIPRDEVFIGNVLKCRPPGNRNPAPDEAAECRRYLDAQIAAIRPKFVLTLGNIPTQLLLGTEAGITRIRGTPSRVTLAGGEVTLLPTYHPSYLLRNPPAKREAWEDLKLLHRLLREATGDWPPPLQR